MRPRTDHAVEGDIPTAFDGFDSALADVVQAVGAAVAERDETLHRLKESVTSTQDERDLLNEARESAQHLRDLLATMRARTRSSRHHTAAGHPQEAVPPRPDETPTADVPPQRQGEDSPDTSAQNTTDHTGDVVQIQGEESQRLLEAMAGKPDHAWSAREVAAALGNTDRREVRRVRSGLTYLAFKGVLEKLQKTDPRAVPESTGPGRLPVRYRIVKRWERV
ncbi:hypothetical protein ACIBCP_32430 [Streptomyces sp. NPDC051287]|uniref:hypothetical protein n=1 Tax=Streptomyces sp. NPDC051287 TaxID=3365648 RepID=UPI00378C8484